MQFDQSLVSEAKPLFRRKIIVFGKSWVRILIKTQTIMERSILKVFLNLS